MKHKMELTWHSCTDCLPSEDFNSTLYVTDGQTFFPATWIRDSERQRFVSGNLYIKPGVNSDGYWWADILQTVRGFEPMHIRN